MAPKEAKETKAKAKEEKTKAAEEKKRAAEAAGDLAVAEQRRALSNFVTQAKNADSGSQLEKAYEFYKTLPLHSDVKTKVALSWKADKTCSWLNTLVEKNTSKDTVTQARAHGWRTKYMIAKDLGMDVGSAEFEHILACYKNGGTSVWNENDPAEKPFKTVGLDAYWFCTKDMDKHEREDGFESNFESTSAAKKSKQIGRASCRDRVS
jgi:hypothetical protein